GIARLPQQLDHLARGIAMNLQTVKTTGSKAVHAQHATLQTTASLRGSGRPLDETAIRPFRVNPVPEAELTELRRRINATRWPERETVADASQGVQLATMRALARYWATEYDWRKVEAKLTALPNFITEIDGL